MLTKYQCPFQSLFCIPFYHPPVYIPVGERRLTLCAVQGDVPGARCTWCSEKGEVTPAWRAQERNNLRAD